MSSERDELAQIIYDTLNSQYGDFNMPDDAADEIIAAGWRPPARVIHHPVELMDLHPGSIVIDETDGTAYQPDKTPMSVHFALVDHGPFTVLWEPGDDDE